MEETNTQESEEEQEEKLTLKDQVQIAGFLLMVAAFGFALCLFVGPRRVVTETVQSNDKYDYMRGYSDGLKVGTLQERGKWCEPERSRKPGDMSLECLKLFLDGAGGDLMEKSGHKIIEL